MTPESTVFRVRDRLFARLTNYAGQTLQGTALDAFADETCQHLPGRVPVHAVFHSARYLAGRPLTGDALREYCWRLAGNLERLRAGEPVPPWSAQPLPELMPVQVLEYTFDRTRAGRPAARYQLRILSGRACPRIITKTWQQDLVAYLARTHLGFTWSKRGDPSKYPYQHPTELVRLRFLVEIDPAYCRDDTPGFDKVASSSGALTWNRDVLKARARVGYQCPERYEHACFRCPIGYDRCKAATRPRSLTWKSCPACLQPYYHDPGESTGRCLRCVDSGAAAV